MSEQDYIPGTRVIRNLVDRSPSHPMGTTDARRLDTEETFLSSTRMVELLAQPAPPAAEKGAYTFGHMRQVHQYLFQDVYAWAGEPRRVPMSKRGVSYAEPSEMNALLRAAYARLAEQNYLRGIDDQEQFTRELAATWAEINHGHAFREGNTRSQTVFFAQLARDAGWQLDTTRLSPHHKNSVYQQFVSARFAYQRLRSVPGLDAQEASLELANVLVSLVSPAPSAGPSVTRDAAPASIASRDPERAVKIARSEGLEVDAAGFIDFTKADPPPKRRPLPPRFSSSAPESVSDELQL